MEFFLKAWAVDPTLCVILGMMFVFTALMAAYLARRAATRARRILIIIGMIGGVLLLGGSLLMNRLREAMPRTLEGNSSSADPQPVSQEAMVKSAEVLRQLTNQREVTAAGKVQYRVEWTPDKGVQLLPENCDLTKLVVALSYPIRAHNAAWQRDPVAVVGKSGSAKFYARVQGAAPQLFRQGEYEPLMLQRFGRVVVGFREIIPGIDEEEPVFLVWTNDDKPGVSPCKLKLLKVPYGTAVRFDCAATWWQAFLVEEGASIYPQVVRLCKQVLEEEGEGFFATPPGHAERYLNFSFEAEGDSSFLSPLGQRIELALQTTGQLPPEIFGKQTEILIKGAPNMPYQGKGRAHNLAAFLWGQDLDRTFGGDHILALKVAVFLALNPKARLKDDPKPEYSHEAHANRRYCANVANEWMKLEGFTPFPETFGEEDPSMAMLKFLQHYAIIALPLNGNYNLKTASQMSAEERSRQYLGSYPSTRQHLIDSGYLQELGSPTPQVSGR